MPRQPLVERFKISCETDVTNLGPVMSVLAKLPGLVITGSELVTEVRSFSKNTNPEIRSDVFLEEWTKSNPTFKAKDAVLAFRADGRGNGSSAYHALTQLVGSGVLKKLSEGRYSRADVKAIEGPKKRDKNPVKKVIHDVSASDFALRVMSRNHGKITSSTMKKHFENDHRQPTGTGPVFQKLIKERKVKRVGEGLYELVKAAPKNGAEVEVSANG